MKPVSSPQVTGTLPTPRAQATPNRRARDRCGPPDYFDESHRGCGIEEVEREQPLRMSQASQISPTRNEEVLVATGTSGVACSSSANRARLSWRSSVIASTTRSDSAALSRPTASVMFERVSARAAASSFPSSRRA